MSITKEKQKLLQGVWRQMENLPKDFVQRMKIQLGNEADDFFNALSQPSPSSIRFNHLKGRSSFDHLAHIPWCENGYYLDARPRFHLDPHWHGGAYYVQEPSSMILDEVIKQLDLDPKAKIWLDVCAAPGGKTGILAKHLDPSDILVANEVVPQRKTILWENLVKGGYTNTIITGEQPLSFNHPFADVILIDAPCAGEGMMRKEPEAIHQWSQGLVNSCSLLQKKIVHDTIRSLIPGGYLIYSTCSYSFEENIYNISDFIEAYSLKTISLEFPGAWGITTMEHKGAIGYQLYPHKVKGEGLFIAVLHNQSNVQSITSGSKKQSSEFNSVPTSLDGVFNDTSNWKIRKNDENNSLIGISAEEKANEVLQKFPKAEIVGNAGHFKGKDFIPSHFLAMAGNQNSAFTKIDLDLKGALDYLERSTSMASPANKNGWYLPTFENTILGWMKFTPQGWKNHYPLNWRLRSR